ncbi:triphosphoribosyl-dephospho-CoA synthase [Acinetobacter dispersus]|uniref:triphosphoribosyl-dephospho-CoA synthase n=1 Tax=Acinetobacter dispersus TaxID=70348 RepID=UPI00132EE53E|nr:triphosphoribosyl-dephospho-CoA synthase [Acinetobacter dispersus]MCH7383168.1 triphosphoribosyl-dephospho-CoA synthase [Acinetobacter dispersus]QHH96987.1 triphosphoribosyl-dephospho-CoA synthase [Acinetobacter dispersus]
MNVILKKTGFSTAELIADMAVQALIDEVNLTPKPALVDQRGSGAHDDLTLELMERSAQCLFPMFKAMAEAAELYGEVCTALREDIGQLGRYGEHRMLQVTHGVNTHRGAIWSIGLVVTSAALILINQKKCTAELLCKTASELAKIEDQFAPIQPMTHGQKARQKFGINGAKQQAQQGFPVITEYGLAQLHRSRVKGMSESSARLDALLAMMGQLTDTCVIHRSGLEGLHKMQVGAQQVLALGGCSTTQGQQRLAQLEHDLLAIRASAGGAADLLATLLLLDSLEKYHWK